MNATPPGLPRALERALTIATPRPGDWVLYCPGCWFIGSAGTLCAPTQHNPPCTAQLRIWAHTPGSAASVVHLPDALEGQVDVVG